MSVIFKRPNLSKRLGENFPFYYFSGTCTCTCSYIVYQLLADSNQILIFIKVVQKFKLGQQPKALAFGLVLNFDKNDYEKLIINFF